MQHHRDTSTHPHTDTRTVKVWDPLVRFFHWGVVSAFFIAFLTSEDNFADLHVVAGYVILGLVAVRLVWGLIGTRHARFSNFIKSPAEVKAYLKQMLNLDAPSHVGHNPAAGYMIVALLIGLVLTGVTGMAAYGAEENAGPLAGMMGALGLFGGDLFEELHEFFAFATLGLAGLHVAGVLFSSMLHRENLIRAMITGVKEVHGDAATGSGPVYDPSAEGAPDTAIGAGTRRPAMAKLGRAAAVVLIPLGILLLGGALVAEAVSSDRGERHAGHGHHVGDNDD